MLATRSIKAASKERAIDLAISMVDLTTLEGMDTPGKVRALCAKALRPDLPVALASGYVTPELERSAFEAGANALVYKPNDVNELCETVQRLILGADAA